MVKLEVVRSGGILIEVKDNLPVFYLGLNRKCERKRGVEYAKIFLPEKLDRWRKLLEDET